jgi:hypothetical protein
MMAPAPPGPRRVWPPSFAAAPRSRRRPHERPHQAVHRAACGHPRRRGPGARDDRGQAIPSSALKSFEYLVLAQSYQRSYQRHSRLASIVFCFRKADQFKQALQFYGRQFVERSRLARGVQHNQHKILRQQAGHQEPSWLRVRCGGAGCVYRASPSPPIGAWRCFAANRGGSAHCFEVEGHYFRRPFAGIVSLPCELLNPVAVPLKAYHGILLASIAATESTESFATHPANNQCGSIHHCKLDTTGEFLCRRPEYRHGMHRRLIGRSDALLGMHGVPPNLLGARTKSGVDASEILRDPALWRDAARPRVTYVTVKVRSSCPHGDPPAKRRPQRPLTLGPGTGPEGGLHQGAG